jgi:pre-mRNA-processing factor SLU7
MLTSPCTQAAYVPENFVRQTGDARKVAQMQMFAWQAEERGESVHAQVC